MERANRRDSRLDLAVAVLGELCLELVCVLGVVVWRPGLGDP